MHIEIFFRIYIYIFRYSTNETITKHQWRKYKKDNMVVLSDSRAHLRTQDQIHFASFMCVSRATTAFANIVIVIIILALEMYY